MNIIGLSNSFINDNTIYNEKVEFGKQKIIALMNESQGKTDEELIKDLFKLMEDETKMIDENDLEKLLENKNILENQPLKKYLISSIFVRDSIGGNYFEYGTRHTIIVTLNYENKLKIYEQLDKIVIKTDMSSKNGIFSLNKRDFSNVDLNEFQI
jgi:uncharacterized protein with NRDE domain